MLGGGSIEHISIAADARCQVVLAAVKCFSGKAPLKRNHIRLAPKQQDSGNAVIMPFFPKSALKQ